MSKDSRHEIWRVLDALQMDHRALGAKIVEVRAMVAAMNLPAGGKTARAGSPRELHPDACPGCEVFGKDENGKTLHAASCQVAFPRPPDA